ncbi:hypothetical protein GCM10011494_11990 [Novosphingobium endophyticum]|uniref:Calpastatin n=1 Tax=Novosphingobium endophyticum TaxID=1955250 RepID=A0A916TS58_9SPHN|nr:DUF1810 domain-containing protein [Novosphingobium endophyticum]GGB95132.1 hypothetical protein GCM10011494_11990 [Novosphingobium endophyticum]
MARLERFLDAQRRIYPQALAELRAGDKRSHWMWFIFPQIAGLGRSETARFYAIADLAEAREYLAHPVLGPRLEECTGAMLEWAGKRSAPAILGEVDALKFRSSMTLFEAAGGSERFARGIEAFCGNHRDARTLERIGGTPDASALES